MVAESLSENPGSENSSLQSRFKIALQQYESGQYAQSLEILRDLSQMRPVISEVQLNLGNVYFKLQNNPQAETHWKKAIELDPMEATAYLNLGILYDLYLGRLSDALAAYRQADSAERETSRRADHRALWSGNDLPERPSRPRAAAAPTRRSPTSATCARRSWTRSSTRRTPSTSRARCIASP